MNCDWVRKIFSWKGALSRAVFFLLKVTISVVSGGKCGWEVSLTLGQCD